MLGDLTAGKRNQCAPGVTVHGRRRNNHRHRARNERDRHRRGEGRSGWSGIVAFGGGAATICSRLRDVSVSARVRRVRLVHRTVARLGTTGNPCLGRRFPALAQPDTSTEERQAQHRREQSLAEGQHTNRMLEPGGSVNLRDFRRRAENSRRPGSTVALKRLKSEFCPLALVAYWLASFLRTTAAGVTCFEQLCFPSC